MDPFKATGKPHTLWVAFAKFYEDNGQLDDVSVGVAYGSLMGPLPRPLCGRGLSLVSVPPRPPPTPPAGPRHLGEGHQGEFQAGGRPGQCVV